MHNRNLHDSGHLCTGKRTNHGGKHGLEIPANFDFYGTEKAIKLVKK